MPVGPDFVLRTEDNGQASSSMSSESPSEQPLQSKAETPSSESVNAPRAVNDFQGLHAGYVLIASVLVGLSIGYGIDWLFDSMPWGIIGGSLFFIVAGLFQVVKGV